MTGIVNGPINSSLTYYDPAGYHIESKQRYKWIGDLRQKPLMPYRYERGNTHGYWSMNLTKDQIASSELVANYDRLYALAYDRFHAKAFQQANVALTLTESGKSMAMIARRAGQIFRAARALNGYRFGDFARELGLDAIKHRAAKNPGLLTPAQKRSITGLRFRESATKSLADTWLEFTFGWVPLIQDIGSAVEVLQQDFQSKRVRGIAKSFAVYAPMYAFDDPVKAALNTTVSVSVSAVPKVTNPNLLLAKQLGFTNPAYVAWDAVPFSFVVDWFVPVGKFLSSFDNEVGYGLSGRCVGVRVDTSGFVYHVGDTQNPSGPQARYTYFDRTTPATFPRPDLFSRVRVPQLDPWHAATSVSLAVQQLSGLLSRK